MSVLISFALTNVPSKSMQLFAEKEESARVGHINMCVMWEKGVVCGTFAKSLGRKSEDKAF